MNNLEINRRICNLIDRRIPIKFRDSSNHFHNMFLDELHLFGLSEVDTKWEPPEGLFKDGSSLKIAKEVWESHDKNLMRSLACINFYINRAGKNLSKDRLEILEKAKERINNWSEKENKNFSKMKYNFSVVPRKSKLDSIKDIYNKFKSDELNTSNLILESNLSKIRYYI